MKCRLKINSRGSGWSNDVCLDASLSVSEGAAYINYILDGDACTLFLRDGRVEQTRKGSVDIKITFCEGQKTACIIGGEGLRGGYSVYTKSLSVSVGRFGCNAALCYLSGEDEERIEVKISALSIK